MFFICDLFYYHLKHTWMHAWGSQIYIYILFTVGSRLLLLLFFFFKKKEKQIQELKMRWKRGPTNVTRWTHTLHSTPLDNNNNTLIQSLIHSIVWFGLIETPKLGLIPNKNSLLSFFPLFSPLFLVRCCKLETTIRIREWPFKWTNHDLVLTKTTTNIEWVLFV